MDKFRGTFCAVFFRKIYGFIYSDRFRQVIAIPYFPYDKTHYRKIDFRHTTCFPCFAVVIDQEVVSKDDAHFQLPYRMILPNGIENLSVSGRCASCDDDAIQTVRMMVCCATTGQAAGTASALSIKDDVVLRDLDIHTLQNQLVADGVRIR